MFETRFKWKINDKKLHLMGRNGIKTLWTRHKDKL